MSIENEDKMMYGANWRKPETIPDDIYTMRGRIERLSVDLHNTNKALQLQIQSNRDLSESNEKLLSKIEILETEILQLKSKKWKQYAIRKLLTKIVGKFKR